MKKYYIFLLALCLLFSGSMMAQALTQTFYTSGTYTVPAGYTAIVTIQAWGGGGSGGGGNTGNGDRSGGGGGAFAQVSTYTLTGGTYTVTVGNGGIAPTNNIIGQSGSSSSFSTIVVAAGGTGGSNAFGPTVNGGSDATSVGTLKYKGGNGGARSSNVNGGNAGGGGGGSATATGIGADGAAGTGNTGGAGGIGQGNGGTGGTNNAVGSDGVVPGAGGGGKGNAGSRSGNGAAGLVRVLVLSSGPLPITVNYFNGVNANGLNSLNWSAVCTSPNVTFEVERSFDGASFTSINTIPATMQRCSSPFDFVDNNKVSGIAYYRIKIIDYNGKISYTAVVKITSQITDMKLVGVYPNPVINTASFNFSASKKDNVQLSIINFEGRILQSRSVTIQPGSSNISVDVTSLAKGTYLVKAVFSDGQSTVLKFVKQ